MSTLGEHKINKTNFPRGEWDNEPDKKNWKDPATGLDCMIVRNGAGALCGYVAVTKGHPDYGKDYNDVPVDVHGGLTYADECSGHICHVPAPGEPDDVWWFGFDCAHLYDLSPAREQWRTMEDTYRNIAYVERECTKLAKQLKEREVQS